LQGAGAVVTRDVPDYALVVGNPAHQVGWMSEAGEKLVLLKAVMPNARLPEKNIFSKGESPKGFRDIRVLLV
jgi:hypothetical protein